MIGDRRKMAVLIAALAVLGSPGCDHPMTVGGVPEQSPSLAVTTLVMTGIQGTGAVGNGAPTYYGQDRQWFTVNVSVSGGLISARLEYVDSAFVKDDGNYPHFVVGPEWPGTAVTSFVQTSSGCADFEGVGYLINTGELLAFSVETCDNAQPGARFDTFGITVPQRLVTHGNPYQVGPAALEYGELTASGVPTPTLM